MLSNHLFFVTWAAEGFVGLQRKRQLGWTQLGNAQVLKGSPSMDNSIGHNPCQPQHLHTPRCCLVTKPCPTLVVQGIVACQAPLSMGFPRQEYWSGSAFPSLGDLSNPRILHWQVGSLPLSHHRSLYIPESWVTNNHNCNKVNCVP